MITHISFPRYTATNLFIAVCMLFFGCSTLFAADRSDKSKKPSANNESKDDKKKEKKDPNKMTADEAEAAGRSCRPVPGTKARAQIDLSR